MCNAHFVLGPGDVFNPLAGVLTEPSKSLESRHKLEPMRVSLKKGGVCATVCGLWHLFGRHLAKFSYLAKIAYFWYTAPYKYKPLSKLLQNHGHLRGGYTTSQQTYLFVNYFKTYTPFQKIVKPCTTRGNKKSQKSARKSVMKTKLIFT